MAPMWTATDGFIDMDATGDILLSHLRTTTQVDIDSSAGSILDNGDSDLEIVADKAQLQAAGNIGVDSNTLEINVAYLEAYSSNGGIFIDDEEGLIIGVIGLVNVNSSALNTLMTGLRAKTNIRVTTTGFMRVKEDVESTEANIMLEAIDSPKMTLLPHPNGNKTVSALDNDANYDEDLIVEDNADIKGALSVTLLAGDDMLIGAGSVLTTDADDVTDVNDTVVLRIDHTNRDDYAGVDANGNVFNIGARFDLLGSVFTTRLLITGERGDDTFYLNPQSLSGHTRVLGDISNAAGGNDWFILDHLPSITTSHTRPDHLLADGSVGAVLDTIDLDGLGGTDHYVINVSGGETAYLVNVKDTGKPDDGADTLRVHSLNVVGTAAFDWDHPQSASTDPATNDIFLLRKNFVAYLTPTGDVDGNNRPVFAGTVERINYDHSINGRLLVSAGAGDDQFYVDDNSAITTLDGGLGKDTFQIGQVFGSNPNGHVYADGSVDARFVANDVQNIDLTSDSDDIELLQITRGWLSQGITHALTAFGGEGGDTFNVYSNKAVLRMEGESGNDTFVIRAFIAEEDIIAEGGNDDDHFEYNINAPISINGGLGFDTVVLIGTERADAFIITDEGIFGAGLNVRVDGVEESIEVDGLEGDDYFYILSTRDDVITTVIGGLGSDSFIVTGDVTQDVVSQNLDGLSAVINHGANSAPGTSYDKLLVDGIPVTIANQNQGKVIINQDTEITSPGFTRVTEGIVDSDGYWISLFKPDDLDSSSVAYLTVSAAVSSSYDRRLPTRNGSATDNVAESILISIDDGATWQQSAVLTFTEADWDTPQRVLVKAANDDAIEGERKVMISHSLLVESGSQDDIEAFNEIAIPNVEVQVLDDDLGTLLIEQINASGAVDNETRVLEGGDVLDGFGNTSAINDTYRVRLSVAPVANVTVDIGLDSDQLALFDSSGNLVSQLTFTADTSTPGDVSWNDWVTLTVKAVNTINGSAETIRENSQVSRILHDFSSLDSVYNNAETVELEVRVLDDDAASVLVSESNGETKLVKGVSGDDYSLRLVNQPTAHVTVNLFGDGQTNVLSATLGTSDRLVKASIGQAVNVAVTIGRDTTENEGIQVTRDTLKRTDGSSWLVDGYRIGTLFTIDGGTMLFKVNDIVDDVNEETGAVVSSTLVLTLDGDVTAVNGQHAFQRMAYAVTFDAGNWWQEVRITIEADVNFVADSSRQFLRNEPVRQHLTSQISGPLIIEGGVAEGKDRSLKPAVMLPAEFTLAPINIEVNTDETQQADRLNVFNDSSVKDDKGWLSAVELRNDVVKLGNPVNLSGLGMSPITAGEATAILLEGMSRPLSVDISDAQDGSGVVDFPGGITFDDIEITEILLGQGNDTLTVNATSQGTPGAEDKIVTVIHGGGNSMLNTGVMGGDHIIVNGGGGAESPLVIYGDTSQDGSRYDSRPDLGIFTGNGIFFNNHGNDIIDASASSNAVTIYGGRGNDTINGSQAGDQLAGGSGDDHIYGEGGDDHIYGDSGFNLDFDVTKDETTDAAIVARLLTVPTVNSSTHLTADAVILNDNGVERTTGLIQAGEDFLYGNAGADIIFGDHGEILQTDGGLLRLVRNGEISYIATVEPVNGMYDKIEGNDGDDRLFGGNGGDLIGDDQGNNIVFGDFGYIDYAVDGNINDIDKLGSFLDTVALGGSDTITTGQGDDIVLGGRMGTRSALGMATTWSLAIAARLPRL